jgi:hypothetical protein
MNMLLEAQGVRGDPAHLEAAAVLVTALLEGTARYFASLPLEAEPAAFQAAQRRHAP